MFAEHIMQNEIQTKIKQLSEKIKSANKDNIHTEEEVKNSFILPFLAALGYDVFDTNIIKPEYTADIGSKKGEKVDYAILQNGEPLVLIEAKHFKENLNNHNNQLVRYFQACASKYNGCRFAILTNGIEYRFFSDTQKENVMDETPFLIINLENLKDRDFGEIRRFAKDSLNLDEIKNIAKTYLYHSKIKEILKNQIENPDDKFVEFFARQITDKPMRQNVLDEFREYVKKTLENIIADEVRERLNKMQEQVQVQIQGNEKIETTEEKQPPKENEESAIVTTEEELQAFYIVQAICAEQNIDLNRIVEKDTINYFNVLLDGKVTKWICRFYFNNLAKKTISFPLENEKSQIAIQNINEIYKHKALFIEALNKRLENK